jgi:hypothetical protein
VEKPPASIQRIFNSSPGGGVNIPGPLQKHINEEAVRVFLQFSCTRFHEFLFAGRIHCLRSPLTPRLHKSCVFTLVSFTNPRTPFHRRCEFPPGYFQPPHAPQPIGCPLQPPSDLRRKWTPAVQRRSASPQHRGVAAADHCAGRNAQGQQGNELTSVCLRMDSLE